MHRFDGYNLQITQGDTLLFTVTLAGRTLPDGTQAVFTVKRRPRDGEKLSEKRLRVQDGAVRIALTSEDTALPARSYVWDLRILIPGDAPEVETPMEYAAFTVLQAVGEV